MGSRVRDRGRREGSGSGSILTSWMPSQSLDSWRIYSIMALKHTTSAVRPAPTPSYPTLRIKTYCMSNYSSVKHRCDSKQSRRRSCRRRGRRHRFPSTSTNDSVERETLCSDFDTGKNYWMAPPLAPLNMMKTGNNDATRLLFYCYSLRFKNVCPVYHAGWLFCQYAHVVLLIYTIVAYFFLVYFLYYSSTYFVLLCFITRSTYTHRSTAVQHDSA